MRALLRALLRAAARVPAAPVARKARANALLAFRARAVAAPVDSGNTSASYRADPDEPADRAAATAAVPPASDTDSARLRQDAWLEDGRAALRLLTWLGTLTKARRALPSGCRRSGAITARISRRRDLSLSSSVARPPRYSSDHRNAAYIIGCCWRNITSE